MLASMLSGRRMTLGLRCGLVQGAYYLRMKQTYWSAGIRFAHLCAVGMLVE